MGFFDRFSSDVELTPAIALATSMIYMMSADGEISDEELNYLATKLYAIGDADELIRLSAKYSKKQGIKRVPKRGKWDFNKRPKVNCPSKYNRYFTC